MAQPVKVSVSILVLSGDLNQRSASSTDVHTAELATDSTAYTTDTTAFCNTLYTTYSGQVGGTGVSNVEILTAVRVAKDGAAVAGQQYSKVRHDSLVAPANGAAIKTQLDALILSQLG